MSKKTKAQLEQELEALKEIVNRPGRTETGYRRCEMDCQDDSRLFFGWPWRSSV